MDDLCSFHCLFLAVTLGPCVQTRNVGQWHCPTCSSILTQYRIESIAIDLLIMVIFQVKVKLFLFLLLLA